MGVTLDCWRARIGLYKCLRSHHSSENVSWENIIFSVVPFVALVIILLVGNVELNPGPVIFKCVKCSQTFQSLSEHATHQRIHGLEKNFQFICAWPTCSYSSAKYSALYTHLHREKHEQVEVNVDQDMPPECSYSSISCNVLGCEMKLISVKDLCHHLLRDHLAGNNSETSANVCCPFENCRTSAFPTKASFSAHLGRSHKGWLQMDLSQLGMSCKYFIQDVIQESCSAPVSHEEVTTEIDPYLNAVQDDQEQEDIPSGNFDCDFSMFSDENLYEFVGKFYLMLEGQHLLPSTTVQKICEYVTFLSEILHSRISASICHALKEINLLSQDQIQSVLCQVSVCDFLYNSHHKDTLGPALVSAYLRKEFYKSHFKYSDPTEIFLTKDRIHTESVQYVPIKDTVEMLLADPSVQSDLLDSFSRETETETNNLYLDYYDGSLYKEDSSQLPKERIDLFLFQDGFSCTNPIGSAKKKHNMVGSYVNIANLKPHNRTKTDAKRLVMMVDNTLVKKHGFDKCYRKLIDDLRSLFENGVKFMERQLPVYVILVIGDNLGQHSIGGFIESFSKKYFCRFCMITREEFLSDCTISKELRTVASYRQCLLKINLRGLKNCMGVKLDSVLNCYLEKWHVCDPRLAPCLAHDLFHGVVDWDFAAIIANLVKKKWFSYSILNKKIAAFKLHSLDSSNKPAPVPSDGKKLGGHAVQNWCLLRLFPIIMNGFILDTNDTNWQLYLKLKKICEYICAPSITENQIKDLERLLLEYMKERKNLGRVRPKHHFVFSHYPNLIRRLGPLIHLWTLRFEQKHSFFKRVARACQNFVHLSRTLALHHQLNAAYMSSGSVLPDDIRDLQPLPSNSTSYEESVGQAIMSANVPADAQTLRCVTITEVTYKKGAWVILKADKDQIIIGCIELILACGDNLTFVCKRYNAFFDDDHGYYKISDSEIDVSCIPNSDKANITVQPVYDLAESLVFSLKSSLPEM